MQCMLHLVACPAEPMHTACPACATCHLHVLGSLTRARHAQVLARIGRGALVALPALGALFVAALARQDWGRWKQERRAKSSWAAAAFAAAFVGDAADVGVHVAVVGALTHHHFGWGLAIGHDVLASVEGAGVAVAVASTVAATVGELLAARAASGKAHARLLRAVEANAKVAAEREAQHAQADGAVTESAAPQVHLGSGSQRAASGSRQSNRRKWGR